ncbi:MAG TPA: alpha/beta hydrolase [Chitinophagaceae bacterium]|nr:alpha/beta hydrolase [Chitinophagaceae bacterium]
MANAILPTKVFHNFIFMEMRLLILLTAMVSFSCNDSQVKEKKDDSAMGDAINTNKVNAMINVNNVNIVYDQCGSGDTTLLFLHGWCINKEYWSEQKKYFCDKFKVVTLDLPGFGQSGKNRTEWSFERYANDINEFINTARLENVILIGHSMSGDILLLMDTKYPGTIIGMVGIDNLKYPAVKYTKVQGQEMEGFFTMLNKNFSGTVEGYTKQYLFPPSADVSIVSRVISDFKSADSAIAIKVLRSMSDVSQKEKEMMENLTHKLYLVNSDMTPTDIEALKKSCKFSAEVVYVKGTGHYPMIEKPAEFNAALERVVRMIGNKLQP